jgi:hypothetical protein
MELRAILCGAVVLTTVACSRAAPPASEAAPSGAAAPTELAATTPKGAPSLEEELEAALTFSRAWRDLTIAHKTAIDALAEKIAAAHPAPDFPNFQAEPEFMAQLELQKREMQRLMDSAPKGPHAKALAAAIGGVGTMQIGGPKTMAWVPARNEAALEAARKQYGSEAVDLVLAREAEIHRSFER